MRTRMHGFIYFALTIAGVLVTLTVLNWLPLIIHKETLRRYAGIDEARMKLNIKDIRVPSYFPQSITWPPAEVLAQGKPYPGILMIFHGAGKQDASLIISQAASDAFPGNDFITFANISETVSYGLKDRNALLEVGTCKNNEPCSRLTWKEGDMTIKIAMKAPPFELVKIAESMLH